MPHDIVNHLKVIADMLVEDNVPPHIPGDLLAKLRTAIGGSLDDIPAQTSGHLYELLKWREMIHERPVKKVTSTPLDAKGKADVLAQRSDGRQVATQAKWTTGESKRGAYGNLNKAVSQLGGSDGERPPVGAALVADVVITKVPAAQQLSHDEMADRIRAVSHTAGIEMRALQTEITVPGNPVTDLSTKTTYWSDDGVTGAATHGRHNPSRDQRRPGAGARSARGRARDRDGNTQGSAARSRELVHVMQQAAALKWRPGLDISSIGPYQAVRVFA